MPWTVYELKESRLYVRIQGSFALLHLGRLGIANSLAEFRFDTIHYILPKSDFQCVVMIP